MSGQLQRGQAGTGVRIPARELEAAVISTVREALADPLALLTRLGATPPPDQIRAIIARCEALKDRLGLRCGSDDSSFVERVEVTSDSVTVQINSTALAGALGVIVDPTARLLSLMLPGKLARTGQMLKLVQPDGRKVAANGPSESLVRLLTQAHGWNARLRTGGVDINTIASEAGCNQSYVSRVIRLAYLAPDVLDAFLTGTQRADVGAHRLVQPNAVPSDWAEQRRLFLPDNVYQAACPRGANPSPVRTDLATLTVRGLSRSDGHSRSYPGGEPR